jgi:glucokinase
MINPPPPSGESPVAIGIDFGGTTVKLGLVRDGVLIHRAESLPTLDFSSSADLLDAILHSVENLRKHEPAVAAIGAGLPGIVDSRAGIVHHLTNVPGWSNVPLRDVLRERTGLPSVIENDANAMTYAEWRFGAGRGRQNVVCVTLGTGVGGGLILDGRLYRGSRMGAGEIGNMSIDYRGVPGVYGNFGALEQYVGNQQIAARAQQRYQETGTPREPDDCTPLALELSALKGDRIAQDIWEETGVMLGAALSDVIWLLNPDSIILGGGVAKAGELIFSPIRRTIASRTSEVFYEELDILPAQLGSDAGLIGCGALALDASYSAQS